MKLKIVLTILILIIGFSFNFAWMSYQGPVQGDGAVKQLNDSDQDYAAGKAAVRVNVFPWIILIMFLLIVAVWIPHIKEVVRITKSGYMD